MYSRMRGARADVPAGAVTAAVPSPVAADDSAALASTLREIAREMAAIRAGLEHRSSD